MTPEEVELLQYVGQVNLRNISALVVQSVLYGLYLMIFLFGIHSLTRRAPWNRYTWLLFSFLVALFVISTANLATMVALVVDLIRGVLVNDSFNTLDGIHLADDSFAMLNHCQVWVGGNNGSGFLFILADAVVIWRACVLWPGNKLAKTIPLTLLLASFGSMIVSSAFAIKFSASSCMEPISSAIGIASTLSLSLSLATNIVATLLFGYKTCQYRKLMKFRFGINIQDLRTGAVLLFLTESGIAFCFLQLVFLFLSVANKAPFTKLDYAASIWQRITIFAAAAYPVSVLLIVDSYRPPSELTFAHSSVGEDSIDGSHFDTSFSVNTSSSRSEER